MTMAMAKMMMAVMAAIIIDVHNQAGFRNLTSPPFKKPHLDQPKSTSRAGNKKKEQNSCLCQIRSSETSGPTKQLLNNYELTAKISPKHFL